MIDNNKKYALVTSSTKGIGKAIAVELLKNGYFVILNYFNDDKSALDLLDDLKEYSKNVLTIKADMTNINGVNKLVDDVKLFVDKIDVIVLNTGLTCKKDFKHISYEDWDLVMNANINMPFFLLQKLNKMINDDGRIIFIGAVMGLLPHAISIPYAVSKSAFMMLSQSLVKVFSHRNITVNTIAVGFVETDWHLNKDVSHKERIINKIALKRFGYVEEVAMLCKHIIENQYLNGAILRLDGGYDAC